MNITNTLLVASIAGVGTLGFLLKTSSDQVFQKNQHITHLTLKAETLEAKRIELASSWITSHSEKISVSTAEHIASEVFKYPNPLLIISLIEVESEFVQSAVSRMGALGLGQIMYNIHQKDLKELGINNRKELFDIDKNVKATSFILQMMLKKANKDVVQALHFYLGGKDKKYISRVFSNYIYLSLEIENALPKM